MFKKVFLLISIIVLISSCGKEANTSKNDTSYLLNISIDDANGSKVYLQNLNLLASIDSTTIVNGNAIFNGTVTTPERYLISIENVFGGKLIILENDSINVLVKNNDLINAQIIGSKLNDELLSIQKKSEKIYAKIDLLFPDLQRARLENNAAKLSEISSKMKAIEQENIDFHFDYVQKHPNSYIAVMILSDLSKRDSIDTKKVKHLFDSFSSEVKKSSDAQKIVLFLENLH